MLAWGLCAETSLTIGAAASLTDVMGELKTEFEKLNPEIKLVMTFAATGAIRMQIENGAPVDVFASANSNFGGSGDYTKILDKDSVKIMCMNALVFAVGKNSSVKTISGSKRLGIGNPDYVPAGKYAKKLLESKKLWAEVKERLIMGTNVRQVLAWLEQGAVDGGFVYSTDAAMSDKLKIIEKYTVIAGKKIVYPVAISKQCRNQSAAKKFISFLLSDEAKKKFNKYGFITKFK
jgi:molybdate transport system substrate-binding protein